MRLQPLPSSCVFSSGPMSPVERPGSAGMGNGPTAGYRTSLGLRSEISLRVKYHSITSQWRPQEDKEV